MLAVVGSIGVFVASLGSERRGNRRNGRFFASEVCDEGGSPGCAAVIGVGLLVAVGVRRDVRPDTADQNGLAVEGVLGEEFAATLFERANGGRIQNAGLAVDKRLTPLMGLRVVEKECHPFPVTGRAFGLDLFELSAAIPDLAHGDGSVEFDRFGWGREGVRNALDVGVPDAKVEVEVVLPVTQLLWLSFGDRRDALRDEDSGQ